MLYVPIDQPIDFVMMKLTAKWYSSPSILTNAMPLGVYQSHSIGNGIIKSGSKFVKDENADPCGGAIIRCYMQTKTLVMFVSQQAASINGIWEFKGLNKELLYTITAEFDGYEKVVLSNVFPI